MQNIIPFIARCLISLLFLVSGVQDILKVDVLVTTLEEKHIAFPPLFAAGAIIFLIAGSLSLIAGFKSKVGAFLLLIFLVPTTLLFHFNLNDAGQTTQLLKNVGLAGALLYIIAYGAGGWSLDARMRK